MNAGGVENPDAFGSDVKTANSTPVNTGSTSPEPNKEINPEEPIGDDGVNYDVYADSTTTHAAPADTPDMNFSSEDIKDREKTNYFINIEGAEKAKREAERKQEAESRRKLGKARRADREARRAERAAAAERARQQKYNDASEKSAKKKLAAEEKQHRKLERAARRKQRRLAAKVRFAKFLAFLWVGKHKVFTILGLIVLTAGVLAFIFVALPYIQEQQRLAAERAQQEAIIQADKNALMKIANFLDEIQSKKYYGSTYEQLAKEYEDAIANAQSDAEKVRIIISYANFIYKETKDTNKAIERLSSASDILTTDSQRESFYSTMVYLQTENNNTKAAEHYRELLKEVSPYLFDETEPNYD